jgi:hypothetical protein
MLAIALSIMPVFSVSESFCSRSFFSIWSPVLHQIISLIAKAWMLCLTPAPSGYFYSLNLGTLSAVIGCAFFGGEGALKSYSRREKEKWRVKMRKVSMRIFLDLILRIVGEANIVD